MEEKIQGGIKAAKTTKERKGQDFHCIVGALGGKASRNGGFASDKIGADGLTGRQRAALMGKQSKRGKGE